MLMFQQLLACYFQPRNVMCFLGCLERKAEAKAKKEQEEQPFESGGEGGDECGNATVVTSLGRGKSANKGQDGGDEYVRVVREGGTGRVLNAIHCGKGGGHFGHDKT